MTKYFENPDTSLDDSFEGPLKELNDLNLSGDSFLPISPRKSSKPDRRYLDFRKSDVKSCRNTDNKENIGVDKLPVIHRGPHGEQTGTLIVRHFVQKDSKCIQCRNCGIFFTVNSFLKHCHDQHGKRSNCNAVQLQLGLDISTSQQRDVWNAFQKRLLSNQGDFTILRSETSAARHMQNFDRPSEELARQNNARGRRQRTRGSSVEIPLSRRVGNFSATSFDSKPRQIDDSLYRSRKFPSSSALSLNQASLSLSEFNPERGSNRMTSSYGGAMDRGTMRAPYEGRMTSLERPFPDRMAPRIRPQEYQTGGLQANRVDSFPVSSYVVGDSASIRPWDTPDFRDKTPLPSPRPILSMPSSMDYPIKPQDLFSDPITSAHKSTNDLGGNSLAKDETTDEDPKELINKAISLMQSASDKMSRDRGQNSNAWRKMYEEERDHRMQLESKVRDLERELRSRKT